MKEILKNALLGFIIGCIYGYLILKGIALISVGLIKLGAIMAIIGLIIAIIWWGRIFYAVLTM